MISDDDLLLYYYRDGLEPAERARIGAALSAQPELAQRMQSLVARLDAAAAMPDVPVPAETQRRWELALERAAARQGTNTAPTQRSRWLFGDLRFQAAAAAAAVVAIVFAAQFAMRPTPEITAEVTPPAVTPEAATTEGSAYERGLKWHLASTERTLAGLDSAKPEERTRLIETIVTQNRMYALAAERAGEPQLARVLRAFSPILEDLAKGGGESTANVAQLSFELRVMQGRLSAGADTSSSAPSTTL